MEEANPKGLVSGYERHIPALTLPDANDLHVLATAIEAKASVIVTFNLKDFPQRALSPHGIRALSPDAFLVSVFRQNRPRFLLGIRQHRSSLRNPSKTVEEYLSAMRAQKLLKTASRLEGYQAEI